MNMAFAERIINIKRALQLPSGDAYDHYVGSYPHIPSHLRRILGQVEYAVAMEQAGCELDTSLIDQAIACLEDALVKEGTVSAAAALKAEEILLPLKDAAKQFTVHMVAHAHIDMNWMWPWHETVEITLETFRTMLKLMDEDPEFKFSQSQASTYKIVEEFEPEMLDAIRQRVKEGRWEVTAATWVEADKNMPNGESMVRHLLYTRKAMQDLFGIEGSFVDYEPDTFGHAAGVPEILHQGGVKYYYHCRGYQGHSIYRWRAANGHEVLAYREPRWYLGGISNAFANYIPSYCKEYGITEAMEVYGVGDHGGGPTRKDLRLIHEMQQWPVFPTLAFSTYNAFFGSLEKHIENFPVVQDEHNVVFTGCYTTQVSIKAGNRRGEYMLARTESAATALHALTGAPYHKERFEQAWVNVLFNQFHDILTGSGVQATRHYANAKYSATQATAEREYAAAMRRLSAAVDTSAFADKMPEKTGFQPEIDTYFQRGNRVFTIANFTQTPWSGPVKVTAWDWYGRSDTAVVLDKDGNTLPVQWVCGPTPKDANTFQDFLVDITLPAYSWTTICLVDGAVKPLPLPLPNDPRKHHPDVFVLENEIIKATFDSVSGNLKELLDKRTGKVMGGGKFILVEEATDKGMTSWVTGRYRKEIALDSKNILHTCGGALRSGLQMTYTFGQRDSSLRVDVTLDKGSDTLVFNGRVDWHERGTKQTKILQLAFVADCADDFSRVRYMQPTGLIERPTCAMEMPTIGMAVALPENADRVLELSSTGKYAVRGDENRLHMPIIRSAFDPDALPDQGAHDFCVALSVVDREDTVRQMNIPEWLYQPVTSWPAQVQKGSLPASYQLLEVTGARVSAVKASEDGKAVIVRVYEGAGCPGEAVVKFNAPASKALRCNLHEAGEEELPLQGGEVTLQLKAHEIATIRFEK
ncbi:MAG: alpha-mannosidase [Clostridiales bacterium]|nr:alpha-mannosidase [Clostridiales bacterium]